MSPEEKIVLKRAVQEIVNNVFEEWPCSSAIIAEKIRDAIYEGKIEGIDKSKIGELMEGELNQMIEDCIDSHPSTHAENTDFDRLDDVFNALIQKGVFCVHHVRTTPSSCWSAVKEELDAYKQKKIEEPSTVHFDPESIWAVAYYHSQDTSRAASGAPLNISFIAVADGEQEKIDVIRAKLVIMGMLKQFGFKLVDPSLDPEEKIFVAMNWLVPFRRVSNMEQNRGMVVEYARNPMLDMPLEAYKKTHERHIAGLERYRDVCQNYYIGQLSVLITENGAVDKVRFILEKLKISMTTKSLICSIIPEPISTDKRAVPANVVGQSPKEIAKMERTTRTDDNDDNAEAVSVVRCSGPGLFDGRAVSGKKRSRSRREAENEQACAAQGEDSTQIPPERSAPNP